MLLWARGNYYQMVWKYSYIVMGPRALVTDATEIFLYFFGTLGIVTRRRRNIPYYLLLYYYYSYNIMGAWELFHKGPVATATNICDYKLLW